jgi:hypothetical protein
VPVLCPRLSSFARDKADFARIDGQMTGGEVRLAPHHRCRLPASKLLQDTQRRSVLYVP